MQDVQRIKPFCLEIGVHLVGRGPPVIMVALHDDLLPRQALKEGKVPAGIGQAHGPADVTRQHDGVLRLDELPPVFFQTLHIIVPARKDIHRLGSAQRKMGVAKHKKCHVVTPVLTVQQGCFMPDSPAPPRRSARGRSRCQNALPSGAELPGWPVRHGQ